MAFWNWLFGRKKGSKSKAERSRNKKADEIYEDDSIYLKSPEEMQEKPARKSKAKKVAEEEIADIADARADKNVTKAPTKEAKASAAEKKTQKASVSKTEVEKIEEKSVEEIDAAFSEAVNTSISEEVAEAEKKIGRKLARFEIKKAKDGRFVFNLFAPNRVIVATSQIYTSSTSAVNGIKSIAVNAPKAPLEDTSLKSYVPVGFPKWEIYVDKAGEYRFRLYAPNGSCIVHSQGYTSKASCKNGIASIVKNAPDAIIDKSYLKKDDN